MKLWLLSARKDLPDEINPWNPWYDRTFELVVRAKSEEAARRLAHENGGPENGVHGCTKEPWLDPNYSTCEVLTAKGRAGVILKHIRYV